MTRDAPFAFDNNTIDPTAVTNFTTANNYDTNRLIDIIKKLNDKSYFNKLHQDPSTYHKWSWAMSQFYHIFTRLIYNPTLHPLLLSLLFSLETDENPYKYSALAIKHCKPDDNEYEVRTWDVTCGCWRGKGDGLLVELYKRKKFDTSSFHVGMTRSVYDSRICMCQVCANEIEKLSSSQ
jgi:hypothetical protein